MSRIPRSATLACAAAALSAGGCATLDREYEAALLLGDLSAEGHEETRLQDRGGDPERTSVRYDKGQGEREADLYRPDGEARGNLVLIHGLTEQGKDDRRLVEMAESLTRVGYRVLVPEVEGLRELRWGPENRDDVADAVRHMANREASRGLPLGVSTLSLMSGPVLLATADDELRRRVEFVALIGGYYDLEAWLRYITTGYDALADAQDDPAPRAESRWVLLQALASRVDGDDREWLQRIAERRLDDPESDIGAERAALGEEAAALVDLLANDDPQAFDDYLEQIPAAYRDALEELDPSRRDWSDYHPELLLVHGTNDRVVPFSHSEALEAAAPEAHLYRSAGLAHVELEGGLFDSVRLWRAASALLDVRLEPDRPLAEDAQRNVYIPPRGELERTLRVGAVYNDEAIQIRYEFATEAPSWYHQYWVYEVEGRGSGGEWVRYGSGGPEPDEHGLYEDRISMLLDDGDVGLDRYGGFMTAHEGMRGLTGAAGADEVRAHPHLGETLGRSDVRKYIPQSREDGDGAADWAAVRDEAELEAMRERGEFLDLWQWRAHRSHPLGYADNGYVLEYRHSSAGRGMFTDNWDDEAEQPRWMYDPDEAGFRALDRERLFAGDYDQDDLYYLSEGHATDFDPDHPWEDGDVLPQRFLQEPDGSRGAIRADGGYEDGAWRVRLTRSLEAPDPTDSHALEPGEVYDVAFAVHEGVGQRWHRVSMPHTLALAGEAGDAPEADIVATYTEGDLDEAEVAWADIGLIYPGQMTWDWLIDRGRGGHPGAGHVLGGEDAIGDEHRLPQLQDYLLYEERRRIERSE